MLSVSALVLLMASVTYGQKYCCYPDQWEGQEALIIGSEYAGHTAVMNANLKMSMDATMEAIAIDEKVEEAGQPDKIYKILQLYKQQTQYTVSGGRCEKTTLEAWAPSTHCIPDNATMLRKYYYGNQNKLHITVYAINVDQHTIEVGVTDDCIPATELVYGNIQETNMMTVSGFFNLTMGIKDPSVFNIPDICKQAPLTGEFAAPKLRRRRSLFSPLI